MPEVCYTIKMMNLPNIHSKRMLSFLLLECFIFILLFTLSANRSAAFVSVCINVVGVTSKCLLNILLLILCNKIERANPHSLSRIFTFKFSNVLDCFPPALALIVRHGETILSNYKIQFLSFCQLTTSAYEI